MSIRICYSCGSDQADTTEHVIAKSLIPEPRPDNLITVPACRQCNESVSKDEEYLRDRLSAAIGGPDFDVPQTWDVAWRSMQRKEARGKKLGLFKDGFKLPKVVQTKNGPSDMAVKIDKQRTNRVIEKMIRGFYFYHFRKPLGVVRVQADILSSVNPAGDRKAIMELIEKLYECPTWAQNFGSSTHVICGLAEEDERAGLWSFKLLAQHILVALVAPESYFEERKF